MASPLLRFHTKLAELRGMKPLTEPPPCYAEWLAFCFGRQHRPGLEVDMEYETELGEWMSLADADLAALFEVTMRRSGVDLASCSDAQLGEGLDFIFNASRSDISYQLRTGAAARERKVNAVRAMKSLYDDVLTPRVQPRLGHLNETGHDRLSMFCYMLWDVTGLAYWPVRDEADAVPQAILEVLEHALLSPNDAVVESGLHGIGHRASPERAKAAVGKLLARRPDLRPELKKYAEACAIGYIQ